MSTSLKRVASFIGINRPNYYHKIKLTNLIELMRPTEVHHGMTNRSDEIFHNIVREILPECRIVGHSHIVETGHNIPELHCDTEKQTTTRERYINDMLNACQIVIALVQNKKHGGNPDDNRTPWYMINKALKQGKEVCIIWSDGRFERHEAKNG